MKQEVTRERKPVCEPSGSKTFRLRCCFIFFISRFFITLPRPPQRSSIAQVTLLPDSVVSAIEHNNYSLLQKRKKPQQDFFIFLLERLSSSPDTLAHVWMMRRRRLEVEEHLGYMAEICPQLCTHCRHFLKKASEREQRRKAPGTEFCIQWDVVVKEKVLPLQRLQDNNKKP